MQLVRVVYFPSMIAAMLINNQLLHGSRTQATLSIKTPYLSSLGLLGLNKLHKNRHYIQILAEIILLCSQQQIALRGHQEGEESMNKGNYVEILNLIALHDPVINERLKNGPKHAKYTSPHIQNSLIHVMGAMVYTRVYMFMCTKGRHIHNPSRRDKGLWQKGTTCHCTALR